MSHSVDLEVMLAVTVRMPIVCIDNALLLIRNAGKFLI